MQLSYQKFDLPLRHVFTISRGSMSVQPTLIVQLKIGEAYGYGEATTNSFYGATIEKMSASLESVRSLIEGTILDDPLDLIAFLARKLPGQEFALSATIFGQAVHSVIDVRVSDEDLAARMRRAGFGEVSIRDIAPTLEDVFVTLTEQEAQRRGEGGGPVPSKA